MALELGQTRLPQADKIRNKWSQKRNNLHLNEAQKALTLNALAQKAKARLPKKMVNLTFRNLHNPLIINNVHRMPTCRLFENWRVSPCRTTASSVSEPNLTSGCIAPMSARSYNLAANAGIAVSFAPMLIYSWHFHGQKYGTAKNASIRNCGDAYENLTLICETGNNGFVESAWMFIFCSAMCTGWQVLLSCVSPHR